jgi:hypothetical protein
MIGPDESEVEAVAAGAPDDRLCVEPPDILGSVTLDAGRVYPPSVSLADAAVNLANAAPKLRGQGMPVAALEDVNDDGRLDLVAHIITAALALWLLGNTRDALQGRTLGGIVIRGSDSVRVLNRGQAHRRSRRRTARRAGTHG